MALTPFADRPETWPDIEDSSYIQPQFNPPHRMVICPCRRYFSDRMKPGGMPSQSMSPHHQRQPGDINAIFHQMRKFFSHRLASTKFMKSRYICEFLKINHMFV